MDQALIRHHLQIEKALDIEGFFISSKNHQT